jgi:TolB-like protein
MYKLLPILLFAVGFAVTTADIYDNSYALIIGIDKYQNVKNLNYAVKDAKSMQSMMVEYFDFPKDNVKILLNEEATYNNIRRQFSEISKSSEENDRVLIFFAGHGETIDLPEGGEKGYLLPYDGDRDDLYLTAVAMDELKQIAFMSKAKHILYLVDACYGGIAVVGSRGLDSKTTPNYIEKITKNKARQIITAGGRGEKVIEKSEWGHSAFTLNLNRGLKDRNADLNGDDVITANELGLFLSEKVTIDSDNQQTPQYGRMTTQEGEFIFMNSIDPFGVNSIIGNTRKIMPANIAIIDFEGIGVSIKEARILTQRLASEIISLNVYQLFERSKVDQLLKEQKFQHSGCVDAVCAVEIGKLVGVQHMVIGTVSKIGNTYSVDSRIIDVESGKSFISAKYSTQNSIHDVITNGMESISYQLCNMGAPKPAKPSFFERMYKNRGKIILVYLALWIGWGLLPA